MPKLYNSPPSGNCYKIRLLCSQLGIPLKRVDVDIFKGETRTPEFLAKNPNGRVPLFETDDGRFLPESNAVLLYLAEGTDFLPKDRFARAQAYQWLFFEQYSHEPYIAVARFWWSLKPGGRAEKADRFPEWHERGHQALEVMERHLSAHDYFAGGAYSVADIALYAYTHTAEEGGFDLAPYKAMREWLKRITAQPGHITLDD